MLLCRPLTSLEDLTETVAQNNFYSTETDERDAEVMRFLRERIKHVIYIVKENRTFDQLLGDLTNGANGDPDLAQFPQVHHAELSQSGNQVRDAGQLHESG